MFIRHRLEKQGSLKSLRQPKASDSCGPSATVRRQRALKIAQCSQSSSSIILQHPEKAIQAAQIFVPHFHGLTMYAVKANPCPHLLQTLWRSGIDSFDVASIQEIRMLRQQFPTADLYFMNPVKSEYAIGEAYSLHGVKTFALDSQSELDKILAATDERKTGRKSLTLCVRIAVSPIHSKLSLGGKYGVDGAEALSLLRSTRQVANQLGVCFHVGSQSMDPQDFVQAIRQADDLIRQAGVRVDVLDVGGGFPASYPGLEPPPVLEFVQAIHDTVDNCLSFRETKLWAEPGRWLSAEYNSLIVRVEKVKGDVLYANDGAYGNMSDAKYLKWPLKATLLRERASEEPLASFTFYGPTLDGGDVINGVMLPGDVTLGDSIWFETMGAYGTALRTSFCHSEGLPGFVSSGMAIAGDL